MVKPNRHETFSKFEQFLKDKSRNELAGLLIEYVMESNHQSWDGHPVRDQQAYAHLFEDMMLTHESTPYPETVYGRDISDGSHTYRAQVDLAETGPALKLEVSNIDNRDYRTTWLWVSGARYIEVDPIELVANAVENLPEEEQEHYSGLLKNLEDG